MYSLASIKMAKQFVIRRTVEIVRGLGISDLDETVGIYPSIRTSQRLIDHISVYVTLR
jgi:hypothetical protein